MTTPTDATLHELAAIATHPDPAVSGTLSARTRLAERTATLADAPPSAAEVSPSAMSAAVDVLAARYSIAPAEVHERLGGPGEYGALAAVLLAVADLATALRYRRTDLTDHDMRVVRGAVRGVIAETAEVTR